MRILITGAGGFLGFVIAKKLVLQGHKVTNFSRSHHSKLDELKIKTIQGNLANPKDVFSALKDQEAVFHIASKVGMWGKWEDFYNTNYLGTKNIIKSCKKHKIKYLVYTSTPSVVFGREELCGLNEDCPYPTEYFSLYAKSKAMAEKEILASNKIDTLHTTALRPHLIFGPNDPNIIPRLLKAAKKEKLKIIGDGKNLVDVIYVDNAADAHLKAFQKIQEASKNVCGKAFFLGQETPVNLWNFINSLLSEFKLGPIEKRISFKKAYRLGHIIELFLKLFRIYNVHPPMTRFVALQLGTSHYFNHDRARNFLDFEPSIKMKEAIKLTTYIREDSATTLSSK